MTVSEETKAQVLGILGNLCAEGVCFLMTSFISLHVSQIKASSSSSPSSLRFSTGNSSDISMKMEHELSRRGYFLR